MGENAKVREFWNTTKQIARSMFARQGPQQTYAVYGHILLIMVLKRILKGSLFSCFSIWSLNPETDKGQVVVLGLLGHNLLAQQGVDK